MPERLISKFIPCDNAPCRGQAPIEDAYDKKIGSVDGTPIRRQFVFGTCNACGGYVEKRADAMPTIGTPA